MRTVVKPTLTSVTTHRTITNVYPKKDHYRDSVQVRIVARTSTGSVVQVTGTAKLTRRGKVVKTWKLTKSTQTITWNGRIGNRITPGTYSFVVSERAAGGKTRTHTTKLVVHAGGRP